MKLFKVYIISVLSILILIGCVQNFPPEIPSSPEGPTSGFKYESITFKASTTDPDGDNISYQFNWGDGNLSIWSDYIPSGDTIVVNHSYNDTGMLEIRVRAKDNFRLSPIEILGEHTSDWSLVYLLHILESEEDKKDIFDNPRDTASLQDGKNVYVTSMGTSNIYVVGY